MNKFLSFGVCFKSAASFSHPQYILRTSPRSIPCAWNSRIWHFHLNNTLLPRRNVWNLVLATSRPETMKLTCQFRRFLRGRLDPWEKGGDEGSQTEICRIVVPHDDRTKLELSSARCQQGADSWTIHLNNLFTSTLRNDSGNQIVLLLEKTNPSVGIRRKKHRQPVNKPF